MQFARTGKEGSVLLRVDEMARQKKFSDESDKHLELRTRKAGAFKRLEPTRHLPIPQEEINDYSWDACYGRIKKIVDKQNEWKATHVPVTDKYKNFSGVKCTERFDTWLGTRAQDPKEAPIYGSTYQMEIGEDLPYMRDAMILQKPTAFGDTGLPIGWEDDPDGKSPTRHSETQTSKERSAKIL